MTAASIGLLPRPRYTVAQIVRLKLQQVYRDSFLVVDTHTHKIVWRVSSVTACDAITEAERRNRKYETSDISANRS